MPAPTYWAAILDAAEGRLETLGSRARTALGGFAVVIAKLRTRIGLLPLPEMLDAVLEETGYRAMLADGSEEGEERWANLLELLVRPLLQDLPLPEMEHQQPEGEQ